MAPFFVDGRMRFDSTGQTEELGAVRCCVHARAKLRWLLCLSARNALSALFLSFVALSLLASCFNKFMWRRTSLLLCTRSCSVGSSSISKGEREADFRRPMTDTFQQPCLLHLFTDR